jgi:hypothetical protein
MIFLIKYSNIILRFKVNGGHSVYNRFKKIGKGNFPRLYFWEQP